ncbi:adenosylcobinamide kinase [Desulforamulus reducens MI-1]|uniref:Adenosylcobinamide kinase n=1 Tax=Desulforamulus reducens (strain ATCC BAA-1160 / DSM 100696 / MI-1) TaxID=349161 RepID=A4J5S8_DESRM|nr:bifunctional adenosylcobinamide kinase/adenosylcobinamide-phosphate guanylyltransferase [Desulforamulus reducens]ABO50431.1 adenosylcobinamide kinase [Desulforamulus reducens MI-1]
MKENKLILVLGGTRSGKSQYAEKIAKIQGQRVLYLATATVNDNEMKRRVRLHQERRPDAWDTREEPIKVTQVINELGDSYDVILLDCLTLWITNLLLENQNINEAHLAEKEKQILQEASELALVCSKTNATVIVVSNEVGLSIVPEYPLGRVFRDISGLANQIFAQRASEVYFVAAGLPLSLKGN